LLAGDLLALANAVEQGGQVVGGEFPVERPGGVVVAVHEDQQDMAQGAQAGEVAGGEDFFWMTEKTISSGNGGALPPLRTGHARFRAARLEQVAMSKARAEFLAFLSEASGTHAFAVRGLRLLRREIETQNINVAHGKYLASRLSLRRPERSWRNPLVRLGLSALVRQRSVSGIERPWLRRDRFS